MSAKQFRLKGTVISRWDFRKEDSFLAFGPQRLEKQSRINWPKKKDFIYTTANPLIEDIKIKSTKLFEAKSQFS